MKKGIVQLAIILGLFATACYAKDPALAATTDTVKPPSDAATSQASGKRSATDKPSGVHKNVGSGAVVTPGTTTLVKTYKDCKYDAKGHITNAPCTGTLKDDKGVTWWP